MKTREKKSTVRLSGKRKETILRRRLSKNGIFEARSMIIDKRQEDTMLERVVVAGAGAAEGGQKKWMMSR